MVTQLPSTGAPLCDTSDLLMIHGMFRKVYSDAPVLVSAVVEGDASQLSVVADHIDDISQALHQHHHGEDVLLWDQLEARAPACAVHVGQMKQAHAAVSVLLTRLDAEVLVWRATGSDDSRDTVAQTLDEIRGVLFDHLGREETDILPFAQASMPQAEWNKLGEHGRASTPRDRQFLQLGHILSSMPESEAQAWLKANLPAPARLLWRLVGKRQFEAQSKAMRAA